MRKFSAVFLFCCLLLSIGLRAQTSKFTLTAEQSVGDTVYQWFWKSSDDGELFPFLRVKNSQIDFIDAEKRVLAKFKYLPLSKIAISPSVEIVSFVEAAYEPANRIRPAVVIYHVCGSDGEEIFSYQYAIQSDEPYPEIYVNDAGDAILADGAAGLLRILRNRDNEEISIDLFEDDSYNYERPIDLAISRDGQYFAVVAQKKPFSVDESTQTLLSGEPYLFLFSIDGTKIWQQQLPSATLSKVSMSPQQKFIVTSHYTPGLQDMPRLQTSIFSFSGTKIMDVPVSFRICKFSGDEKLIFLADTKEMVVVNLLRKSFESYPIVMRNDERMICGMTFFNKKEPLILVGKPEFAVNHFEFHEIEIYALKNKKWMKLAIDLKDKIVIKPSIGTHQGQIGLGFTNGFKVFRETHE